jgi:hypothetical protein
VPYCADMPRIAEVALFKGAPNGDHMAFALDQDAAVV